MVCNVYLTLDGKPILVSGRAAEHSGLLSS
uniref:Uncharacterized protein n=1 Tax=Rhizophora mucronata TaxID=61149 RepID=A0A2P2NJQ9_RHIMU